MITSSMKLLTSCTFRFALLMCGLMICHQGLGQSFRQVSIPVGNHAESEDIRKIIEQNFPLIRKTGTSLEISHFKESPGGRHFTFTQTYQGIPVYGAGIKANLIPKNRITSLIHTLADFSTPTNTAFSYPVAVLEQRMAETEGAFEAQITPVFYPSSGTVIPAYQIRAFTHGPVHALEIIVDAGSGTELFRMDKGAYFHPSGVDTTGRGRVFLPNPCTRGSVAYGFSFTDDNDNHSPVMESLMDTIPLRDITYEGGVFKLEGPYVKITDRASFFVPPATSADGDFFFGRDASGFEDVMTYFHVDTFQRIVQALGFKNLQNKPFELDPHGKADNDQSVFVGNGGNSYILFGDGGVDDAEDADVIIHEYIHALSYDASPETNTGTQRRGLDEGFGDYFAAVYSQMYNQVFGWAEIFNWDGHNEFWQGRMANSTENYPPTGSSIYDYGALWASTLMQIRDEIGDSTTNKLALQTLYSLYSQMTLPEAATLFLQADTALYGGIHSEMIIFGFCQRSIMSGPICLSVSIPDPESGSYFSFYPNPGRNHMNLEVKIPSGLTGTRLEIYNLMGQKVLSRNHLLQGTNRIEYDLPSGVYTISLVRDEIRLQTERLLVE